MLDPVQPLEYETVLLRTVPTNSKIFLPWFMIMQEMLIVISVIEIQFKENWGLNHAFSKDNS